MQIPNFMGNMFKQKKISTTNYIYKFCAGGRKADSGCHELMNIINFTPGREKDQFPLRWKVGVNFKGNGKSMLTVLHVIFNHIKEQGPKPHQPWPSS